jgi:hypothetical protein
MSVQCQYRRMCENLSTAKAGKQTLLVVNSGWLAKPRSISNISPNKSLKSRCGDSLCVMCLPNISRTPSLQYTMSCYSRSRSNVCMWSTFCNNECSCTIPIWNLFHYNIFPSTMQLIIFPFPSHNMFRPYTTIRILGGGVQIGSTRHVGHWMAYCTCPRVIMMMGNLVEWTLAGETEVLGENLLQHHFVHHKSHLTRPGLEPGPPRWKASD